MVPCVEDNAPLSRSITVVSERAEVFAVLVVVAGFVMRAPSGLAVRAGPACLDT
ncbi:hypothetical protein Amsp01_041090 [Amycolatopsis sp. NBRC 101858]|nr:hypothetical protein Amsp01_041090 [Amycolatopsis sp. NBRC 101858]